MLDALHLTIFDDNVLANFTAIVLSITEVPFIPPSGGAGSAGTLYPQYEYPTRQYDPEKKYKKVTVTVEYNGEQYQVQKIVQDTISVTTDDVEILIVENKPIINIKTMDDSPSLIVEYLDKNLNKT